MLQKWLYAVLFILISSCAQLPPDTVKLSNSIGIDLKTMNEAHVAFVNYYFDNAENDIINFINDYYKPTLIRNEIALEKKDAKDPAYQQSTILYMLPIAFKDDAPIEKQDYTMELMENFIKGIYDRVETYKTSLLAPLKLQRAELLAKLNSNYLNIQNKNATVTAMISSVVKVHESQQELLEIVNIDKDLRANVGTKLTDISKTIADFKVKITDKTDNITNIKLQFDQLKASLEELNEKGK